MIRRAKLADLPVLTELALELWPDHGADKMYFDLGKIMTAGRAYSFLPMKKKNRWVLPSVSCAMIMWRVQKLRLLAT